MKRGMIVTFKADCVINGRTRAKLGDQAFLLGSEADINNTISVQPMGKRYPIHYVSIGILNISKTHVREL